MNCESHPGAIWFKNRRPKPLATFEARERQNRRDMRKAMRMTMAELRRDRFVVAREFASKRVAWAPPSLENN